MSGPLRAPIPRRRLHAPEAQAVTFVELFFDLVFVFAVTQVTSLTADDLTPGGIARSLLLFWLIWWAWTQFTWTLNPADTNHDAVRVLTISEDEVARFRPPDLVFMNVNTPDEMAEARERLAALEDHSGAPEPDGRLGIR